MMYSLVVGSLYTRAEIRELIGLDPRFLGGSWATGYVQHDCDWFVFANVNSEGRTGHDYGNAWVNGSLHWSGKTNSRREHPSIQSLLIGQVFIFTREDNRSPFAFAGLGKVQEVIDTVPVQIVWEFATDE